MNSRFLQKFPLFFALLVTFFTFTIPFRALAATVTIDDVSALENNGTMTFTATLDNVVAGGFSVRVDFSDGTATGGGTDYVSTFQTLSFSGTAGETVSFTVPLIDDTLIEDPGETFTVAMSNISPAASATITDTAIGTILNDDHVVRYAENSPFGSVTHGGNATSDYPDGNYIVHAVDHNSSLTFTVVAANSSPGGLAHNHHISDIIVDTVSVPGIKGAGLTTTTYTLSNITTSHTLDFLFTSYVDVTVHGPGHVDVGNPITATVYNTAPASIEVESHASQLFTNVPDSGRHVSAVKIDGALVGQPGTYSFDDMFDKDHTYEVWFGIDQFTLVPISHYDTIFETSAETTKAATRTVDWKTNSSYYINLDDPAHSIQGVLVDNISYPIPVANTSTTYPGFIFTNNADNYLQVEFTQIEVSHRLEVLDFDTSPISDSPLDAKLRPKPASLMFTLDDSGSMDWEVIVPGGNGLYNNKHYVYSYPNNKKARVYGDSSLQNYNQHDQWKSQWSEVNKMFYSPEATYAPWPTFTGTPSSQLPAVATNTDGYQTPEVATDNDALAHANYYRPRYHPWLSVDCPDAIKLANGDATANLDNCNTRNYNNNTFNMDTIFLELVDNTATVQVDNTDTAFASTGIWGTSPGSPHIGSNYLYTTATSATKTATWTLTPANSGTYRLDAFWRIVNGRKTNVPYTITCTNCGGGTSVVVDQKNNGNDWYSLGDFNLVAGETVKVTLTDNFNALSSSGADAIRIVQKKNIINAHYYTWADQNGNGTLDWTDSNNDKTINIGETVNEDIYLVNLTDPIEYYKVVDNTQVVSATNLTQVAAAALPATVKTFAKPTDADAWKKERQNWADWFSYYRKRNLAATGAVSQVIARSSEIMVGFHTINYRNNGYKNGGYGYSQSLLPVNVSGIGDETNRLLDLLYGFQVGSHGTPLRNGLYKVGQYCDDTDASTGGIANNSGSPFGTPIESPFHAKEDGDECKQVFGIVMTDGYWNGGGPNLGNVDGDNGAPYADAWSDTLADVSMYFFERDLSPMPNLVPDGTNTHQHMTTYSVAFGVSGSLVPEDYDFNPLLPLPDYPTWPKPVANTTTAVDDLWHAGINGHGKFLNASRPDELVQSIAKIVGDIGSRIGSGASVSVNGDKMYESLNGQLRMYQTNYNSGQWYGDLKAYALNTKTGEILSPNIWSAEETLAAQLSAAGHTGHTGRIIATYNGSVGKPFRWDVGAGTLNTVQKKQLAPYFANTLNAENVIDYLRGDSSNEGVFRDRDAAHPLGDFINSEATHEGGFLYLGGNDGMLHAFYADDTHKGKELFAYVPSQVYPNLRRLANPLYQHRYFVDNTPYTKEISDKAGSELTLLVGGLGKGGQGYYCLDITKAQNITSEAELVNRVKWEYPAAPATLLTGKTFTFTSGTGTAGADQIKDSNKGFSAANFGIGKQIAVVGANYNNGVNSGSNDGVYKILARATDGSSIDVAAGSLTSTFGDGEDIIITKSTSDTGLGYSFSKAYLVETNDTSINAGTNLEGWVVIFGNGYGSEDGTASLYVLNPETGALLKKIETNVGPFNGMSTPAIIDKNNDLKVDYVYAGDLLGNMWKFDFTDPDYNKWQVAFCDKASSPDSVNNCNDTGATGFVPKPLFAGNANQPITGAPDVTNHSSDIGYTVVFGTGRYIGEPDLDNFDVQSIYGIWDWAPDNWDTGYNGTRVDSLGPPKSATLSNWPETNTSGGAIHTLLEQVTWVDGILTEDTDGDNKLDCGEDSNCNGVKDTGETDLNSNGIFDLDEDTNNNGKLDSGEDLDGDGHLDMNEDTNGNGTIDTYDYYRIISNFEGDFTTKTTKDLLPTSPLYNKDINGDSSVGYGDQVPVANVGWFFDLPGKLDLPPHDGVDNDKDGTIDETDERFPGERVTNDAIIRDGRAIFTSFGVTGKRCNAGAYSFLIERNPSTGGMVTSPVYDLNKDGRVDSSDYVYIRSKRDENNDGVVDDNDVIKGRPGDQLIDGRIKNPAIVHLDENTENKYLSTSQGAIQVVKEKGITRGVYMWQQIH